MNKNLFRFKQFEIDQSLSEMKVGTDGVLIGAWSNCTDKKRILDIGAGTGLISLMLAQRTNALIYACESESQSALEADLNFKNSPWNDRLNLINAPIQKFNNRYKFDLIISNPPYFELNSKNSSRQQSRQQYSLSHDDLLESVNKHLSQNGQFDIILPRIEGEVFIQKCLTAQLYLHRKCYVFGKVNSKCKRLLLSFTKKKTACEESKLVIENHERHSYTEEYKDLTKDFYLKF